MNKTYIIIMLTLAVQMMAQSVVAQVMETSICRGWGFGYRLNEHQQDFGIGLDITSPSFFKNITAMRLKVNRMWFQYNDGIETNWMPYAQFSAGLFGVSSNITETIRIYGEGGVSVLVPSSEITNEDWNLGGYGLFGFEFFANSRFSYFIELGGMGHGVVADKLPGKPIYSNGMSIGVGFRIYLKQ